jgi:hypothetical protein
MMHMAALIAVTAVLLAETALESPMLVTQIPRDLEHGCFAAPSWASPHPRPDHARVVVISPDGTTRILTQGFHSATDPDLSFDGQRVLFAGQLDPAGPWRIWEIHLDGSGLRPITPSDLPARAPIYVSTLFTLNSPEPWLTAVFVAEHSARAETGLPFTSSLYNVRLDGTDMRRITFNPGSSVDPFQMWDGRVIYATTTHPQEPRHATPR